MHHFAQTVLYFLCLTCTFGCLQTDREAAKQQESQDQIHDLTTRLKKAEWDIEKLKNFQYETRLEKDIDELIQQIQEDHKEGLDRQAQAQQLSLPEAPTVQEEPQEQIDVKIRFYFCKSNEDKKKCRKNQKETARWNREHNPNCKEEDGSACFPDPK